MIHAIDNDVTECSNCHIYPLVPFLGADSVWTVAARRFNQGNGPDEVPLKNLLLYDIENNR
jgi:hypothetical protein